MPALLLPRSELDRKLLVARPFAEFDRERPELWPGRDGDRWGVPVDARVLGADEVAEGVT